MDWGRKWLDFCAGKTQQVSFDRFSNTGAIDEKIDGSVLDEEESFFFYDVSLLNWIGALTLFYCTLLLLKLPPRKLEP